MKKIGYILFVSALLLSANDKLDKQLNYADSLFGSEKYYEAITEYKRLQFFDHKYKYAYETNFKIGIAYKKGGYYENAIEYFTKAKLNTEQQKEKIEVEFQIVRTNILRNTFDRALQLLDELSTKQRDSVYQNKINYWRGWTYMLWDKWEPAAQSFTKISEDHELKILCESVENDKYSVTFARVISYILPGAGQFYTGNYFSGIMSLGWNILWGYLSINSLIENRAFDGVAVGALLWLRFYRGNIQNAEKLAEQKNVEIANRVLLFLTENYKGEKP